MHVDLDWYANVYCQLIQIVKSFFYFFLTIYLKHAKERQEIIFTAIGMPVMDQKNAHRYLHWVLHSYFYNGIGIYLKKLILISLFCLKTTLFNNIVVFKKMKFKKFNLTK